MLKKYKFWLVFLIAVLGAVAVAQGCGSSSSSSHTIYGTTS